MELEGGIGKSSSSVLEDKVYDEGADAVKAAR